eukprot:3955683-Amphidinium_carterae.1
MIQRCVCRRPSHSACYGLRGSACGPASAAGGGGRLPRSHTASPVIQVVLDESGAPSLRLCVFLKYQRMMLEMKLGMKSAPMELDVALQMMVRAMQ